MQISNIIAHTYVLFTLTAGLSLGPVSSLYLSLRLRSYIPIPGYTNPKILFPHRILSFFHPKAMKSCWDDVCLLAKTQKQVRNLAPMVGLS